MKKSISTDKAPSAVGPYSQGIHASRLIFTSGQLPMDMQTGALETADIRKATQFCLQNVRAILEAQGASMNDVIKTTVFLCDMNDFLAMNEVYATFFSSEPPARSCVQVAALPKGVSIEIEAIASI